MLHAQDFSEEDTVERVIGAKGFDWDIRFGFSLPFLGNARELVSDSDDPDDPDNHDAAIAANVLAFVLAPVLSSISLGANFQYTIVPKLLAPGIYADIHFNILTWFFAGVFTNWETTFLLLQPEIRFYNQLQLTDSFGLEPFFGYNFMYINISGFGIDKFKEYIPLLNAGMVLKLGESFGLEYSYNFSTRRNSENHWSPKLHRLSFSWALRRR